jgi:hypothetical protein
MHKDVCDGQIIHDHFEMGGQHLGNLRKNYKGHIIPSKANTSEVKCAIQSKGLRQVYILSLIDSVL